MAEAGPMIAPPVLSSSGVFRLQLKLFLSETIHNCSFVKQLMGKDENIEGVKPLYDDQIARPDEL
jgi:hypothetical protein